MKLGLEGVERFAFNAVRLLLSALILVPLALRETPFQGVRPPGFRWSVALYALIASGVYQWTFILGVSRTASGNGSLIMATVPMWTAILARLLLGERLSTQAKLGLVIAFLGTSIVALQKDLQGGESPLVGNIFMLLAALTWAWGTVHSRKVLPYISPMRLSAISSVAMLPLQFLFAYDSVQEFVPQLREMRVWGPLVYAGLLSTGLALPMWSYGVRHSGAAQAAVFQNLVPIVAIASAWLINREPVTGSQILGGALIIGGLILVRRSPSAPSPAAVNPVPVNAE
jgi:drug/metabolite transporter (DMT)-like permease